MALFDWNQDGEKDMIDDLIEYEIYREEFEKKDKANNTYRQGPSGWVTFFIVISGLVIQALFYTAFNIDVDNIPGIVLLILWIGIDMLVAFCASVAGIL